MGYSIYYDIFLRQSDGRGNVDENVFKSVSEYFADELDIDAESIYYTKSCSAIGLGDYRWPTLIDDMSNISRAFPDVVFEVRWNGEDFDDIGIEYWHNGLMHCTMASYGLYNPRRLQPLDKPESSLPVAYHDSHAAIRKKSDSLFELSEKEIENLGIAAASLASAARENLREFAVMIREAYDAENVDALFKVFTGVDISDVITQSPDIDAMF